MSDGSPVTEPGNALVTRYAQHLESKRLLAAALRLPEEVARTISPLSKQAGVTYCGTLDEFGLSRFARAHPLQLVVEVCNIDVQSAIMSLSVEMTGNVFAGNFPLHTGLSSGSILYHAPHGSVVLVPSWLMWKLLERRVSSGLIVGWIRRRGQRGQER